MSKDIPNVTVPEGQKGKWKIERFIVSEQDEKMTHMQSIFSGGRGYVPAGTYTKLSCVGRGTIMSDTPDEKRDHLHAVWKASGHCLINGLGLGMVLNAVLQRNATLPVTKVTVIELEQDVIDLVGPHYLSDPRVEIVNASAFDYNPPKGEKYGMVWHDIWDNICGDNLPEMTQLKRKYGRRTDWQGCWGEYETKAYMRRSGGRYW